MPNPAVIHLNHLIQPVPPTSAAPSPASTTLSTDARIPALVQAVPWHNGSIAPRLGERRGLQGSRARRGRPPLLPPARRKRECGACPLWTLPRVRAVPRAGPHVGGGFRDLGWHLGAGAPRPETRKGGPP